MTLCPKQSNNIINGFMGVSLFRDQWHTHAHMDKFLHHTSISLVHLCLHKSSACFDLWNSWFWFRIDTMKNESVSIYMLSSINDLHMCVSSCSCTQARNCYTIVTVINFLSAFLFVFIMWKPAQSCSDRISKLSIRFLLVFGVCFMVSCIGSCLL